MPQNGMINALMEEYQRAVNDFKNVVGSIDKDEFLKVRDSQTNDPDCIRTINGTCHCTYSPAPKVN